MSAVLLLVITIIFSTLTYIDCKRDLISPPFIVSLMFTFSTAVLVANIYEWNVDLRFNTIFTIAMCIVTFWIGYGIAFHTKISVGKVGNKNNTSADLNNNPICSNKYGIISINRIIMVVIIVLCAYTSILYFHEQMRLAITLSGVGNFGNIFAAARHASYYTDESVSDIVQRLMLVSKCLAYITCYVGVIDCVRDKFKIQYIIYFMPLLIYAVIIYMSGGRMPFIHLLTFVLILVTVISYKKYGETGEVRSRIYKYIIGSFIAFFLIFIIMGIGSGKISSSSVFQSLSIYSGSSINALDIFLNSDIPKEKYFGQETLIPIYSALRPFGMQIDSAYLRSAREMVYFGSVKTNVYTALRRYIRDYSLYGCFLIMFFEGFFYGKTYRYVRSEKCKGLGTILFASVFFPLIEMSIEERFLLKLVSLQEIYEIILITILYYFLVRRKELGNIMKNNCR